MYRVNAGTDVVEAACFSVVVIIMRDQEVTLLRDCTTSPYVLYLFSLLAKFNSQISGTVVLQHLLQQ